MYFSDAQVQWLKQLLIWIDPSWWYIHVIEVTSVYFSKYIVLYVMNLWVLQFYVCPNFPDTSQSQFLNVSFTPQIIFCSVSRDIIFPRSVTNVL